MGHKMGKMKGVVKQTRYYLSLMSPLIHKVASSLPRKKVMNLDHHLDAAADWICKAQDASDDGGIARSFSLVYKPFFGKSGWIASYPETTGYIIPTMFDYAALRGDGEVFRRTVEMADWECDVQLPSGAVMGGTVDARPKTPAVFNTGQVIFGWLRAYRETGNRRYLQSARRAGDYLLAIQDTDGAWRKNLSGFATNKIDTYTYNTRTAWALIKLADVCGERKYKSAAVKNIEHALEYQLPNGWFKNNCLYNSLAPLLHTIAYAVRGILESGVLLDDDKYIVRAERTAEALLKIQEEDGSLPARLDQNWTSTVDYSCLTGVAQTAIIWGRLFQITCKRVYLDAMIRANRFLMSVQVLGTGNRGLDGGISGSFPLSGIYGQYEILNWAVKFFMDSLMLEKRINEKGTNN